MAMLFCAQPALDGVIRRILSEVVCQYLAAPSTQELSANFEPETRQCQLFVDDGPGAKRTLGAFLAPSAIITTTRLLATVDGQALQPNAPFLNCLLAMASAITPPSARSPMGPAFRSGRTPACCSWWPLSDFMTCAQAALIEKAILSRKTSLIGGGTNSGKMIMINSLLNLIPLSGRLLIIENAGENSGQLVFLASARGSEPEQAEPAATAAAAPAPAARRRA
jgi:Flp pilus assembly CpaF family ATPase